MEIFIALVVVFVALFILAEIIVWIVDDARLRGKSPLFVAIAVCCFFPWGLIAWLIFRPDPIKNDEYDF